jgi:hypothetical protein
MRLFHFTREISFAPTGYRWQSIYLSLSIVALLATTGCATHRPITPLEPKPVLLHLPGVAGRNVFEDQFVRALRAGGFDCEATVYDWTRGQFMIATLHSYADNRLAAQVLANNVAITNRLDPQRPIFLTADSGGAAIAVWALESLPADVQVESTVLLAPALSPNYDLSRALQHVRGKMYVFHSSGDRVVLGMGTRMFGTMDGKRVAAAGSVGFHEPPEADAQAYQKLVSVPYNPQWMMKYGHPGNHVGAMGVGFASGFLAPLLTEAALNQTKVQPQSVMLQVQ